LELPQEFVERMKEQLKEEAPAFFDSYQKQPFRGIRINPPKCTLENLKKSLPFSLLQTPFSPLSYYVPDDQKIGSFPMYHAGAFYSQEPSASSAVTALSPQPGERILDLCAAPGGKSTQIGALLNGKGLLWSNEVVSSRVSILLSNIERMGIRNAVISNCEPEHLCTSLPEFFDRVLVDAPCSGEGMFRRDPRAIEEWSPEHVKSCAVRQLAILESAQKALMPGGILVYSTCTFSEEENEGVIEAFLKNHSEFELVDSGIPGGRPALTKARRIYPMDGGEGHFAAKLKKSGEKIVKPLFSEPRPIKVPDFVQKFWEDTFTIPMFGVPASVGDQFLLLPKVPLPILRGLNVRRAGILLGKERKGRLEPEHALFMTLVPENLQRCLMLSHDSPELKAFLRGEQILASDQHPGYAAVAVDSVITGFGKCSGGFLKNHYPKGLRVH
jgi:NOL1/NOP2/sun family putative RNA methylase